MLLKSGLYDYVSSPQEYFNKKLRNHLLSDSLERRLFLAGNPLSLSSRNTAGFKVRRYRSGEMSGAMFTSGLKSKVLPPARTGIVETSQLTEPARQKIRRAVENSAFPLKFFLTLTFDPKKLQPWETEKLNGFNRPESSFVGPFHPEYLKSFQGPGCRNVRHDFAKFRLHRFLDALTKCCHRRYQQKLLYVWVAELQKNGNIHFHILLNMRIPTEYYLKIWKHGANFVENLFDGNHAVNYIRKYMSKDEDSLIQGNRYNICAELRETMKPILDENICSRSSDGHKVGFQHHRDVLDLVHDLKDAIEMDGGLVFDFGFNIPAPRRERFYKDKKTGKTKKTKGVKRQLADNVYELIQDSEEYPF